MHSRFGMIIDIARQLALKNYRGGFCFEYECPPGLVLLPSARIEGKVKVEGDYEIYEDDSVGVRLKVSYMLVGQCSYCLENASNLVQSEQDVLYLTEDDGENYSYNGLKLDLTTAVNDAVLFSQPQVLLCSQDCKGIDLN